MVDGRLNLQDFAESTGIVLPPGTWDTVAGFVLDRLGRLAVQGDIVEANGATIQVTRIDRRRIAELLVVPTETPPSDRP